MISGHGDGKGKTMLIKHSLRVAALSTATVLFTIGAVGPTYAGGNAEHHTAAQTSAAHAHKATSKSDGSKAGTHRASGHQGDRHATSEGPSRSVAPSGHSQANPPKHDPVTVCHLLGNGSYHLLTMDDSALKAHVGHGDLYPVPAEGCPGASASSAREATPPGHSPVTVCHLLGNGSYLVLTFDDSALKAHLGHGDLYPVPAEGCPTASGEAATLAREQATTIVTRLVTHTQTAAAQRQLVAKRVSTVLHALPAAVLGTEALGSAGRPAVLGVEASRSAGEPAVLGTNGVRAANRAPAQVAAAGGVLPQTGAGPLALPLVAGLGLIATGMTLMARRRRRATR